MVLFNYATKELTAKVVYYGPGLCGKTTNLQWVHEKLPIKNKGKMLSLATETDRTLFFDFLPIELGMIRGMKTRIQLYTVPGQVFYNATRRMVLKGADCVVFVADSQEPMLEANLESLRNLRENLEANEINPAEIPMVLQFNKRDLPNALPLEILNERLNDSNYPFYEAVAPKGIGVEETLKGATALVFRSLGAKYGDAAQMAASAAPRTAETTVPPSARTPALTRPPAPASVAAPAPTHAIANASVLPDELEDLDLEIAEVAAEPELEPETEPEPELEPEPEPELKLEMNPSLSDPRATRASDPDEAAELRRKLRAPQPPSHDFQLDGFEEPSPMEELVLDVDNAESHPSPAPAPAPASASAPRPGRLVASPVSVEISTLEGPTEVGVPVEIQLENGGAQVVIQLRLTLNLKLK